METFGDPSRTCVDTLRKGVPWAIFFCCVINVPLSPFSLFVERVNVEGPPDEKRVENFRGRVSNRDDPDLGIARPGTINQFLDRRIALRGTINGQKYLHLFTSSSRTMRLIVR